MSAARAITTTRKIDSIVKAYGKGKSLAELAAAHGVAVTTIRNYLLEQGVTMRSRGARSKG
jgi:2,4-dienoyl-CoA reductase-like NADH-dependent reductase (Old Yellow Enzyme family)